jgi:hypothetical protein
MVFTNETSSPNKGNLEIVLGTRKHNLSAHSKTTLP